MATRRWVAGLVAVVLAIGGAAAWLVADLRRDLDAARQETKLVGLAKSVSDEDAATLRRDLRRTQQRLDAAEARLRRARADLRLARRPEALAERIADRRFCFNPYDARFSGWVRGPLVADVDGDGSNDRVFTVGRPTLLGRSCRYFVAVETRHGVYSTRITGERLWLDAPSNFQLYLAPVAGADVDSDGATEVLVKVSQGASTEAAVLYAWTDGALERVRRGDEETDVLTFSGSLCCGGAFDCVGGYLVEGGYGRVGDGPKYAVTRKTYHLTGADLVLVRTDRHRIRHDRLGRFEEFRGRDLRGCDGYVKGPQPELASSEGPFVTRG
ncbi:MAG TPA: hypothetical protein VHN37_09805 [Actinomycetota bacterium]|nr:hypothetical protein [Actinomycetota bacterium]